MEVLNYQLLPEGVLCVKGIGINTAVSQSAAAEKADAQNTPQYYRANFFNPTIASYLERVKTGTESFWLSILSPTGPYCAGALMLIMIDEQSLRGGEPIQTALINQYPTKVQHAYWYWATQIYRGMVQASSDTARVLIAGNHIKERTGKYRTSRSVGGPHDHILPVDKTDIKTGIVFQAPEHLVQEQKYLQSEEFELWCRNLTSELQTEGITQTAYRTYAPYGYAFSVSSTDPAILTTSINTHHRVYSTHIEKLKGRYAIPQPSYRQYIEASSEGYIVTISPELTSHAGVMEAMNVMLDRSPDHPEKMSPEDARAFHKQVFLHTRARI